jgi:hypothetical protein
VHVARTLKERALRVVRAGDELTMALERSPGPPRSPPEDRLALPELERRVVSAQTHLGHECREEADIAEPAA